MTTYAKGHWKNPFELRPGAKDRFYLVWADFLASGETIATSVWSAPAAVTTSNPQVNTGATLTLDGVEYALSTVSSIELTDVDLGDLVELQNTMTTTSGRIEVQSVFVRGVQNYTG